MKTLCLKEIASTISLHFNPSPAEKAAQELFNKGIRHTNINVRKICSKPPFPGEPNVVAVCNALRDLERNAREGYVHKNSHGKA